MIARTRHPSTAWEARRRADVESALRRVELLVTRRLDGLLHGHHRGLLPGLGTEPDEGRRYEPGDDVRLIDWNVTARLTEPHVRSRIADHELDTWFVVDLSASLDFGTARHTKLELAVAAVAATGLLTATPGNRAGALLLSGDTREIVPPLGGRRHMGRILRRITNAPAAPGATDLGGALAELERVIARSGLVVVVSDFLCGSPWADRLARLAQRQEVLAVEVVDPRELTLPPVGVVSLVDVETGRSREVPTHDPRLRQRYAEAAHAKRAATARAIRDAGGGHLVLRTDSDWLTDLIAFVDLRRRQDRSMRGAARHRSELGTSG